MVRDELIGRLPHVPVDPRPRSRRILETAESVGYEVWLEVFEDVVAGGILLLPRVLQRMSNPLGRSLFSLIVSQHQQLLRWLKTVPGGGLFGFWGRIAPSPPTPFPRWVRGVPQIVNAVRAGVREREWGDCWECVFLEAAFAGGLSLRFRLAVVDGGAGMPRVNTATDEHGHG